MLRILGYVSMFGTKASIERVAAATPIPQGLIKQIGLKRNPPDINHWCYKSPLYRFNLESIDDEVRDFANVHIQLGEVLAVPDLGISDAFFTLCPVEQSSEEEFGCALGLDTLQAISRLGVGLQISPAAVMPEAPFWKPGKGDATLTD